MLSLYQAERTRAEEQLQQKDAQIWNINTKLQQTRTRNDAQIQEKDAQIQQTIRELQQKTVDLNSVQQSNRV